MTILYYNYYSFIIKIHRNKNSKLYIFINITLYKNNLRDYGNKNFIIIHGLL